MSIHDWAVVAPRLFRQHEKLSLASFIGNASNILMAAYTPLNFWLPQAGSILPTITCLLVLGQIKCPYIHMYAVCVVQARRKEEKGGGLINYSSLVYSKK